MTTATASKTVTYKSALIGTVVLHTYVDPCPGKLGTDKVPSTCGRCGGSGYFQCYGHVYGGRCFLCGGAGQVPTNVSTVRKHARTDAFATEYADELAAYWAAFEAAQAQAAAEAEFAAAYDAAQAENAKRDARVQGFLGETGDKVSFTGTVTATKYIAGSYNRSSSMFLVFTTDAGQVVKTFSSSNTVFELERGDRVEITGVVKGQETYNGQQQTVLTRTKAVVLEAADAA